MFSTLERLLAAVKQLFSEGRRGTKKIESVFQQFDQQLEQLRAGITAVNTHLTGNDAAVKARREAFHAFAATKEAESKELLAQRTRAVTLYDKIATIRGE
jgi:hypothetical protein